MKFYILVAFILFTAMPAYACRCMAPTPELAQKTYKEADIVIKARVEQASSGWESAGPLIKVRVLDIIKETPDSEVIPEIISINYNPYPEACGNPVEIGQDYIFAIYDTRTVSLTDSNTRGYGFRLMVSCAQDQVKYYINHLKTDIKKDK